MVNGNPIYTTVVNSRARNNKTFRDVVMSVLYPTLPAAPGADPALVTLANTFSRYASTQQTAYDYGASRSNGGAGGNLLERQVGRALTQVMGRSYGQSPDSFMRVLNDTFQVNRDGQVSFTPSRSAVSMYSPDGNGATPNMTAPTAAGLTGQISPEQANLYRQTSVVAGDALKVLAGLQPFAPEAETDRVDALRALVRTEISALVEEFGRLDEPRAARVQAFLDALMGSDGHLVALGESAVLDGTVQPATIDDEAQLAGFALLLNYSAILQTMWNTYPKSPSEVSPFPLFGERLARASVLLPVIAEGNANLMAAMDSIGFTENERRSSATLFTALSNGAPPVSITISSPPAPSNTAVTLDLPDMTVNDLNEWLDRFASMEGPAILTDSGQYGLEFVTNQADDIFWVLVPILAYAKSASTLNLNSMPLVAQVLVHERVSWALDDLMTQIKALADEAA